MKRNWNWAVWTGASLVFLGVISYPLFFVRFPALRDFPWANLRCHEYIRSITSAYWMTASTSFANPARDRVASLI